MTTCSHSRLSTFEQCKYKYRLQYIDKAKVDTLTTIEAHERLNQNDKRNKTLQR
ncbi:PD-(D/E)XK nuclease family protein [Candidatus Woesearchaeota archaeon]|nr:PD-(D/E)XK nuclease family protein [Candidatus Woesearchaeota archaeon]